MTRAAALSAVQRSIGFTGVIVADVAAADQQRTESCQARRKQQAAHFEFEFNVLNPNLMAPPRAALIIW